MNDLLAKARETVQRFELSEISDTDLIRKIKWLRDVGESALDPDKLDRSSISHNCLPSSSVFFDGQYTRLTIIEPQWPIL